jgi:tetratricopeptide (TPR) repeat protein
VSSSRRLRKRILLRRRRRYQISNIIIRVTDDDLVNGVFGPRPTVSDSTSLRAWWSAYDQMARFSDDPVATLEAANRDDDAFVMGSVFTLAYRLLGGVHPNDPAVLDDVERLRRRRAEVTAREHHHVDAALSMHAGEFFGAAATWQRIAREHPDDFPAHRFLHDVCLHIGDDSLRLPDAELAVDSFSPAAREHGLARGMLSFALEEVGRYADADAHGRAALEADPDDLWARHALAHVYESTQDHEAAISLLVPFADRWSEQTLLSNHVWWHLGLRLLEHGDLVGALEVYDRHLTSTTAFGLADATSLLWRLDLASGDAIDTTGRWARLADLWLPRPARGAGLRLGR